ncbi:MAG: hypothetical protein GXP01_02595 [Alphaproteobacteria bacterium]|nr:hypothetical protein [Alphaproteobacteria bacterium]
MTRHVNLHDFDVSGTGIAEEWVGHSGRHYLLAPVALSHMSLVDGSIYLLSRCNLANEHALWVGTEDNLIKDPFSRALFRSALAKADHAYRLPMPDDDLGRLTALWELDGASRLLKRSAA